VSSDVIENVIPIEDQGKKRKLSKKGVIAVGVALSLLLAGGGAAAFFMLQDQGGKASAVAAAGVDSSSYVEAPPVIVNLRSGDGQARFLKLRFIIVAASPGRVESIKERLPVLLDALQPFLRELRPEDLNGSAAVFRIKEEMLVRAAQSLGTGAVRDVLIQDLVQQ
jgi:flagellar FliL protein